MQRTALKRIRSRNTRSSKPAERAHQKASPTYASGPILAQQAMGNQAMQRMLLANAVQAKLTVNPPDDEYEKEADQVADTVMRMPVPAIPPLEPEKDDEEKRLQTKPLSIHAIPTIQREVEGEDEEERIQTKLLSGNNGSLIQRQEAEREDEEEELLQTKLISGQVASYIQRATMDEPEDEEETVLQTKLQSGRPMLIQREFEEAEDGQERKDDEETLIQAKPLPGQNLHLIQRQEMENEEDEEKKPLQTKPLSGDDSLIQREAVPEDEEKKNEDEEVPIQTKSLSVNGASLIQRKEDAGCCDEEEEETPIQTKPLPGDETPSILEEAEDDRRKARYKDEEEGLIQPKTASGKPSQTVDERFLHNLGSGQPLDHGTRDFFEPRFGQDFSGVRVHSDAQSGQASKTLNAQAFTSGQDIYFGAGHYQPGTKQGQQLLAHELTHVIQQSSADVISAEKINKNLCLSKASLRVIQTDGPDAGPSDAGVPLPAGVPPTPEEIEETRLRQTSPEDLQDNDIGPALELAQRDNNQQRYNNLIIQLRDRPNDYSFGVGLPAALPRGVAGNAMVTPEVALKILNNTIAGRPPFRPELGRGGCSWFVTEGTPYAGVGSENVIPVQAELINTQNAIQFNQAELDALYATEEARARPEVEAQVRERFRLRTGRDAPAQLSNTLANRIARQLRQLAEYRMWEQVAARVRSSKSQVGVVNLPARGRFSANAGRFTVIADASKIRLRGGPLPLLNAIRSSGQALPVPALEKSAEELARTMRLAGRVRQVFRVGGKILIVVAIAVDTYEIITAEDQFEAALVSLSGWAAATGAAAAFAAWWTPADVAGPWAWAGHGVGTLISGAIGYWAGSETTRYIYRLVVIQRGQVRGQ